MGNGLDKTKIYGVVGTSQYAIGKKPKEGGPWIKMNAERPDVNWLAGADKEWYDDPMHNWEMDLEEAGRTIMSDDIEFLWDQLDISLAPIEVQTRYAEKKAIRDNPPA